MDMVHEISTVDWKEWRSVKYRLKVATVTGLYSGGGGCRVSVTATSSSEGSKGLGAVMFR